MMLWKHGHALPIIVKCLLSGLRITWGNVRNWRKSTYTYVENGGVVNRRSKGRRLPRESTKHVSLGIGRIPAEVSQPALHSRHSEHFGLGALSGVGTVQFKGQSDRVSSNFELQSHRFAFSSCRTNTVRCPINDYCRPPTNTDEA